MTQVKSLGLIILLLGFTSSSVAQTLKGKVTESSTNDPLVGANIVIPNTQKGATTNEQGEFTLELHEGSSTLKISFLGFRTKTIEVSDTTSFLNIQLSKSAIPGQEVVISASRFDEEIMKAPSTIEKLNAEEIQSASSGDYYKSLENLKNVEVIDNSLTFKVFNTRGFNTTRQFRVLHYVDGMDIQSPGLNFAPGTMLGVPSIDLANVEVISGPASALYGANAFQGVISMQSKSPFDYPGISAKVKGGTRKYFEGQIRYADIYGKKDQIGLKVTGSYKRGRDWVANDPQFNAYLPIPTPPQDLASLSQQMEGNDGADFQSFNNYVNSNPSASPNETPAGTQFILPAYNEEDLFDQKVESIKLMGSLHYRFTDELEASYLYKFGRATGVYQGNNRANLDNFRMQQHKLELKHPRFQVRAYTTTEFAGDSYDLVLTGINLGFAGLGNASKAYLTEYVNQIDSMSGNFNQQITQQEVQAARAAATKATDDAWLEPGTKQFQKAFESIITNPDRPTGSYYTDESSLRHADGQYNFDWDFLNLNVGASVRQYIPRTKGNIFSDTLKPDGERRDISYFEYGIFAQGSRTFFDDHLKLIGSLRADKSQNYDWQFSPRGAAIASFDNHHVRLSVQSAFRSPTLNDQYFNLNIGPLTVKGNVNGYDNLYTQQSVDQYLDAPPPQRDPSVLQTLTLDPVEPEQLNAYEIGYRANINGKFYADLNAYYNVYSNFIGSVNAAEPNSGVAGESSGIQDLNRRNFQSYSIATNSEGNVSTYGGGLALNYLLARGWEIHGNYTYAKLNKTREDSELIPGFNTPEHKFNIGLSGDRVWQGLGFNATFNWTDSYTWRSPFSDRAAGIFGIDDLTVPSYHTLDLQISYEVESIYSTFRVGGSNIYNNEHIEALGGPEIGGLYYASWTFNFREL